MSTTEIPGDMTALGSPAPGEVRFSVVVPCDASSERSALEATLRSIRAQSAQDLEVLIVGECVGPGAEDAIRNALREAPSWRALLHSTASGLTALRVNEAIRQARGRWIAYQLPGCQWTPDALAALEGAMPDDGRALVIGRIEREANGEPAPAAPWACPPHFSDLVSRNPIALPGVLHARSLLEEVGVFDPHVYLRGFWQWDMWLRMARRLPMIEAAAVIGSGPPHIVSPPPQPDALCEAAFRVAFAADRAAALHPQAAAAYAVDSLEPYGPFPEKLRERLRKFVLVPWRLQHRYDPSPATDFAQTAEAPRLASVLSGVHNCTYEVTIGNMEPSLERHPNHPWDIAFWPLQSPVSLKHSLADQLILHRTYEPDALARLREAKASGVASLFMADDDMLGLWEQFPDYHFLSPGQPLRDCMERQIAEADAAWLYSGEAADAYRRFNPRVLTRSICVPGSWLEREFSRPAPGAPFRIGFAGSAGRGQEMDFLMPVLQSLSEEFGAGIEFVFWGLGLQAASHLKSPYTFIPYSHSYQEYAARLRGAHFDVLLAPLFDAPRARRAKTCIKYLETTAAGTLGIYSDVPPYRPVPSPACGLKTPNAAGAWREAILSLMRMPVEQREAMWLRARDDVRLNHTAEAQRDRFLSGLHAAWLHGRFRARRHADGLPRIAYVFHSVTFAGSENFLCRHAEIAREHGFEPLFVAPAEYEQRPGGIREYALGNNIPLHFLPLSATPHPEYPAREALEREAALLATWLRDANVSLVHSANFIPAAGLAAGRCGLPHVTSLYQPYRDDITAFRPAFKPADVIDCDSLLYARYWEDQLDRPAYCTRTPIPRAFFDVGRARKAQPPAPARAVRFAVIGALHERKGQLRTLQALELLGERGTAIELDLIGLTGYFPDYEEQCHAVIRRLHATSRVKVNFIGFLDDVADFLRNVDACVVASTAESFPQVILESMAARTFVISTPVAGVPELVLNGKTGLLAGGYEAEDLADAFRRFLALADSDRSRILDNAFRTAVEDSRWETVGERLLWMYAAAAQHAATGPAAGARGTCAEPASDWCDVARPFGMVEGVSYPVTGRKHCRLWVGQAGLAGIRIKLGTYGKPIQGAFTLRLKAPGGVVREARWVAPPDFQDPIWAEFTFAPLGDLRETAVGLEIVREGHSGASPVSLFQFEPPPTTLQRKLKKRFCDRFAVPVAKLLFRA